MDWIAKVEEFSKALSLAWEIQSTRLPENLEGWVETYSGVMLNVYDPYISKIHILDIARSLSGQCRFNGHCQRFYSVAEHSVLVSCEGGMGGITEFSHKEDRDQALRKLLHDAGEAYIGDIVTPVKMTLPEVEAIEDRVLTAIYSRFNLTRGSKAERDEIKLSDRRALAVEARYLMSSQGKGWFPDNMEVPSDIAVKGLPSNAAERYFLERFSLLYGVSKTVREIEEHIEETMNSDLPNAPIEDMEERLGWVRAMLLE